MMTFQERAAHFWSWFQEQEAWMRKGIDAQAYEEANAQLKEKLQEILPEVVFEITKQNSNYVIELMPMGNALNRVMMLSLILCMPKNIKHWHVYSYRRAKMGSMQIGGMTLSGDDVTVIPLYDKKQNRFQLKVCCEVLRQFPDKEKFSIMYLMLYEYIGEILTESLIAQVEFLTPFAYRLRYHKHEQLPLTKLREWLCSFLGNDQVKLAEQNGLIYEYYSAKPKPSSRKPRRDTVKGYTAFMDMISECYEEEQPILHYLKQQGFRADYVFVNTKDEKQLQEVLQILQTSFQPILILGVCETLQGSYIDLLMMKEMDLLASLRSRYPDVDVQVYAF